MIEHLLGPGLNQPQSHWAISDQVSTGIAFVTSTACWGTLDLKNLFRIWLSLPELRLCLSLVQITVVHLLLCEAKFLIHLHFFSRVNAFFLFWLLPSIVILLSLLSHLGDGNRWSSSGRKFLSFHLQPVPVHNLRRRCRGASTQIQ